MNNISRRDFLKLLKLVPLAGFLHPLQNMITAPASSNGSNIIILVFDAWSALHLPLYGYPRDTMPNVEAFAKNAMIYHNHCSAGTFTVPGTASILTGLYPWSHRALQLYGTIIRTQSTHHMFSALRQSDSTLAYTQNKWADLIVDQARQDIDTYIKSGSFDLDQPIYEAPFFKNDSLAAFSSLEHEGSSLFINPIMGLWQARTRFWEELRYKDTYPHGLPDDINGLYTLKDVVDGAIDTLKKIKQPTFAYLHFYPPHDPYNPTAEFLEKFSGDGLQQIQKPIHPLAFRADRYSTAQKVRRYYGQAEEMRLRYDQFLASWDAEVSRLFDFLSSSGLVANSYIFATSDHGEIFERGEIGHFTRLIFEPLIHVPLLVSVPGGKGRQDVYTRTSNVDLLPTLAYLTNNSIPSWAEGSLLPGLGGVDDPKRSVFVLDAKQNSSFEPLTQFSASLTKDTFRLTHYAYPNNQRFEFYNLAEDPDELHNLYGQANDIMQPMKDELLNKLSEADQLYKK